MKPKRDYKYEGILDYFLNYLKAHHRELILVKLTCRDKKQILKILEKLAEAPDQTLKQLIRIYEEKWGNVNIFSRRRKESIMDAIQEIPKTI